MTDAQEECQKYNTKYKMQNTRRVPKKNNWHKEECQKYKNTMKSTRNRKSLLPKTLCDDVIVTENTGRTSLTQEESFLQHDIFYPVIDKALCELNSRFSSASHRDSPMY
jgi:hypothetical protein